eukprot:3651770-Pleurochrysis_carterae.AAC.2
MPEKSVLDREASRYTTSPSAVFSSSHAEGSVMRTPLMLKVTSERTKYVSSDDVLTALPRPWPIRHMTLMSMTPM